MASWCRRRARRAKRHKRFETMSSLLLLAFAFQAIESSSSSSSSVVNDCEKGIDEQSSSSWLLTSRVATAECNVERIPMGQLSELQFNQHYRNIPFVLVGPSDRQAALQQATRRDAILQRLADVSVTLSSSNTYSYDKRQATMRAYLDEIRAESLIALSTDGEEQVDARRSNETWYLFGNTDPIVWTPLLDLYVLPPFVDTGRRDAVALSFGVGADASGVQMHVHGPVWAETLHGRKRWILAEPSSKPRFDPDRKSTDWIADDAQRAELHALDCTLSPGEVLWIPDAWWHATINLGETVFISAFV